ncbi:MAG: hypothetical protein ABIG94_04070 [Pseudomonadota bacterium]
MFKRILERFRQDRGQHQATVRVDFFPQDQVAPHIVWHHSLDQESDTVSLVVFVYARILYELAELNETRVARELIEFLEQVCELVQAGAGRAKRPRLPLGQLKLVAEAVEPPVRTYRAEFFQLSGGGHRLEFEGALGKESFYLPAAFLVLLQSCLESLNDEAVKRLARALVRLHAYYRYRRDFWDGGALAAGPVFALGPEELKPEEATPEI